MPIYSFSLADAVSGQTSNAGGGGQGGGKIRFDCSKLTTNVIAESRST